MMSRRLVRWPFWVVTRLVLPLCMLVAIGVGVAYVRLLNGAIPLKPLAGPIARAIAADMPGLGVDIADASIVVDKGGGLELRLRDVVFKSSAGGTVAQAPDAAVTLSTSALWSGRLAPSRIVLIEPTLRLAHSPETGFSLSVGRQADNAARQQFPDGRVGQTAIATGGTPATASARGELDIGAALSSVLGQGGRTFGASSYVKNIGLRNATLVIDYGGQEAKWRVADADFGFDQGRDGRVAAADLRFRGERGPWGLAIAARSSDASQDISVDVRLTDALPSSIAAGIPALAGLAGLQVPINGTASLRLSRSGEMVSAAASLDLGRGMIAPGWRGDGRMPVDAGRLTFSYDPAQRRVVLEPSRVQSGTSWAVLAGGLLMPAAAGQPWAFDIRAQDGMLGAAEFSIAPKPLEAFGVRGVFDAGSGTLDIAEAVLRGAGGEFSLAGQVIGGGGAAQYRIQGRLSPMPAETLKLLWPSVVAPNARRWSGQQIQQGRVTNGTFLFEDVVGAAERSRAGMGSAARISVSIEGSGVRIIPKAGFSPVEAPRVLIRLEGSMLDVTAPDAVLVTAPQRRLPLRGLRMLASDVSAINSTGDLTFRALGTLPPALDIAEQHAARAGRTFAMPGEGIDGRVDAQVRIQVPLGDALTADDTRIDIKGRITDGKARNIFGGYDVSGATISVDLNDQSLDAKGDLLIGGVAAKLAVKRIFAATEGDQPPILITANLDTADRVQLGFDINDFVIGEMPIEVLISPRPQGEPQVQLRGNLTNAEMVIEALAWKKAPGRNATLQFEVVRPSRQRTELQNFRIVGEDISLNGMLMLDGRNKAREFVFNELSLHVVSRLQLTGNLRNDNVWDVNVRGKTLDGRDFFQSLFAVGQIHSKPLPPRKDQAGLDLKAEVDTVLGHHDLSLKGLKLQLSNRGGRTVAMTARGIVEGTGRETGRPLDVSIQQAGQQGGREPRRLVARSDDAGQAFRLIGFYPNMLGGRMQLDVNLDGSGNAEKVGRLYVERFSILGDPVSAEAPSALDTMQRGQRRTERPRLDFNSMDAPFELGHGQLVIKDADVRGDVLGVLLRGNVDFRAQRVALGGTYVPLQGLNSAIGSFPILGQILAGPRGEGVIGMTFGIHGPMSRPQVTVNPVSVVPGFLRDLFQMSNPNPRITPRDNPPAPGTSPQKQVVPKAPSAKSPASPAVSKEPAPQRGPAQGRPKLVDPDGGWTSQQQR